MLHQIDIYGRDKVDKALERLREFEPPEGYYLCFSGGKDSVVIKRLADMAGVKYDAHYNNTGIDPPELVQFIKKEHGDVVFENPTDENGKRITMWNLIPKKKIPPTRLARYCCQELKETGGAGRFCITGVRWDESSRRKNKRHMVEEHSKSGKQTMSTDNTEDAPMFKFCHQYHKRILNPIIDWTDEEVWEFIKGYEVPYCTLYDQGLKRLGCIGCPMSTRQRMELERWPKYKALYMRAFDEMIAARIEAGLSCSWTCAEDVMAWWTGEENEKKQTMITALAEEVTE